MNRLTTLFSILLACASLGSSAQTDFTTSRLQPLSWLQGSWKGLAGDTPFYEAWRILNDSTLVNFSIEIKGADTTIKETDALLLRNGVVTFGRLPNQWTATRMVPNELVLQNHALRFSNTIIWLHTRDDHWFAILENPKSTVYYDLSRDPVLDEKVTRWLAARTRK